MINLLPQVGFEATEGVVVRGPGEQALRRGLEKDLGIAHPSDTSLLKLDKAWPTSELASAASRT